MSTEQEKVIESLAEDDAAATAFYKARTSAIMTRGEHD